MDATTILIASHRVAIQTKFLGPTNYRGSRIRVWRCDSAYANDPHALTLGWNHALDPGENHDGALRAYIEAAGWDWPNGRWVTGGTTTGHVAVWSPDKEET